MRRQAIFTATLLAALVGGPAGATAQETPWPEYTDAQRWSRMGTLGTLGSVAAMAYAKSQGATLDEFGKWWGDLFAPSWGEPGSYAPLQVMRGMRRNFLAWPGVEVEILNESDASVTARVTRPWVAYFGDDQTWYGVTLDEYERLNSMFMRRIAEYHGLAFRERRDGERLVITFARR
jgi:hypothetical protein